MLNSWSYLQSLLVKNYPQLLPVAHKLIVRCIADRFQVRMDERSRRAQFTFIFQDLIELWNEIAELMQQRYFHIPRWEPLL